ncbi:hypothetical protein FRC14_000139 [Serendipita sp. 396]|nr:hypothetical protein FRC14_000139 [Serendipita sp. 396]KAG8789117.1 hypothetical protein FRC15_011685 [Serendipita sp. 397]KAG8804191.1 hypothetical protein FRC16_000131 [Serendipita sp. 398]KAG8827175.1 hypothetical protein FRC19_004993 [Serendipita sp. 401]KAG8834723.1 hypothetical protein FRC18_001588 [Serendipita sp. 400]KAG8854545.1 hypothetical protein FRB91_003356 [Serendipita sp. 411]KAG8877290.1 hypothetical protein FRC20_011656 [Serendipita sp. 405]KAG9057550.1 hypothetical prot
MKESPKPQAAQTDTLKSFSAGFLRKKRLIAAIVTLGTTLFLLNEYLTGGFFGVFELESRSKPYDEFQGMLYYFTHSDDLLPAKLDGSEVQKPDVWSRGISLSTAQWNTRLSTMRQQHPVIVFSKTYCPYSKKAKAILAEYPLKQPPFIIEADTRPDMPKIKALLTRLTGQATYPNVVIGGKSIGGSDRLTILHESGALRKKLKAAGAL